DGDRVDVGRVEREHAFHAFTEGNLANGERSGDARTILARNAHAFVVLDARTRTFGHFVADADGVASFKIGDVFPQRSDLLRFELCDQIHLPLLCYLRFSTAL